MPLSVKNAPAARNTLRKAADGARYRRGSGRLRSALLRLKLLGDAINNKVARERERYRDNAKEGDGESCA